MEAVHEDGEEIEASEPERPGADVIALPQLERLPPHPDRPERDLGALAMDAYDDRASRQEALSLVRTAVELANRIERDAQASAAERLARIDEEVHLRRAAIEERELEVERARQDLERARSEVERARADVEQYRQQAIEAVQEAEAIRTRAEHEAAEKLAEATANADALFEHAQQEAKLAETARLEAEQALVQAQDDAEAKRIRIEERSAESAPARPVSSVEAGAAVPASDDDARFVPPPLSPEDLAALRSLPRFSTTPNQPRRR